MSAPVFFDFGNEVRAKIERVTLLDSHVCSPRGSNDVDLAIETTDIKVSADPKRNLFAVFIEWGLRLDNREKVVSERILVEFLLEDFDRVFSYDENKNTITPKLSVDKQFFGIAYQTLCGVVAARVAGTPWSRRLPSLVDAASLAPAQAQKQR